MAPFYIPIDPQKDILFLYAFWLFLFSFGLFCLVSLTTVIGISGKIGKFFMPDFKQYIKRGGKVYTMDKFFFFRGLDCLKEKKLILYYIILSILCIFFSNFLDVITMYLSVALFLSIILKYFWAKHALKLYCNLHL